ncbi:hypothetical protein [Vibrio ulleungensis]|uniref:Uncharacterized protein n=1 Tax=Vibrio ulleungensis TaxID=2807619 RepID=A0ABS2HMR1_9VIBR|nr:hypothetical protein [Vibrio ulleungensis]MBM7037156.1 hypothetical protein [Vibrio ulleungensis]
MDRAKIEEVLQIHGYESEVAKNGLKVKLGWFANRLNLSWDLSRKRINYAYNQILDPILATVIGALAIHSSLTSDITIATVQGAIVLNLILRIIITELRVIELKILLSQYQNSILNDARKPVT